MAGRAFCGTKAPAFPKGVVPAPRQSHRGDEVCLNLDMAKTEATGRTCIGVVPVTQSLGMKTRSNRRESQLLLWARSANDCRHGPLRMSFTVSGCVRHNQRVGQTAARRTGTQRVW